MVKIRERHVVFKRQRPADGRRHRTGNVQAGPAPAVIGHDYPRAVQRAAERRIKRAVAGRYVWP